MARTEKQPAVYDESLWNSVTYEQGQTDRAVTYRASKTLAGRTAWEFVEKENPGFTLSTICPPYIFGPVAPWLNSRDSVNTSNQFFVSLLQGGWKNKLPPTGVWFYTDVRDVALAHVRAMEVPEADGKRFFVTAGHFDMKEIAGDCEKELSRD
ncbi:hypothetical protein EJ08DRAFT_403470 [Tothia fuscella]|uniref:NAD-dependent epimerase/dehydratase domain-containing protein n=1 Tax=Tothia fuscella TaxID=1048955 RepID=A0A9P4NKY0_9PEZI|nr:hypothetical protein EJ08DRAFT_403470 [Tothia fuscella]